MLTNFQKSIDGYITAEPQDDFTPWVEEVIENFTDSFYKEAYENRKDFECSEIETKWLNKLIDKSPEEAARIIERAYKRYWK